MLVIACFSVIRPDGTCPSLKAVSPEDSLLQHDDQLLGQPGHSPHTVLDSELLGPNNDDRAITGLPPASWTISACVHARRMPRKRPQPVGTVQLIG